MSRWRPDGSSSSSSSSTSTSSLSATSPFVLSWGGESLLYSKSRGLYWVCNITTGGRALPLPLVVVLSSAEENKRIFSLSEITVTIVEREVEEQ